MTRRTALALLLALTLALVAIPMADAAPPQVPGVDFDEAWPDTSFKQPILVTHSNDNTGMLYVVERSGRIYRLPKYKRTGPVPKKQVFLDLTSKVAGVKNAQGGLLGVAFHPQFAQNKRLFVSYVLDNREAARPNMKFVLVVAELRSDGTKAVGRGRPLLWIRKKNALHNGGHMAFGPRGKLFVAVGDGAEKPESGAAHNSQNMRSPLGKILRIDVDGPKARGKQYGIPADNPFVGSGRELPEIWAYGLRNPWRFSFDTQGRLWTAEPGTNPKQPAPPGTKTQEWVLQVIRGGNHGWPFFEGTRQLIQLPPTINRRTLVPRTFAYERVGMGSTAGIGGYVYRGSKLPGLRGKYIFADFGRGHVYALDLNGSGNAIRGTNLSLVAEVDSIGSLGEDQDGELYVCSTLDDGMVIALLPE